MTRWRLVTLALVLAVVAPASLLTADLAFGAPPRDYPVPNGHFFSQANGDDRSPYGFTVSDNGGDLFYTEFQRYGGVSVLGYPISRRFLLDGFPSQAFQKGILQWRKNENRAVFVNVFDKLSEAGYDDWLRTVRLVPNRTIPEEPRNVPFEQIIVTRQAVLNDNPQIRAAYFAARDPLLQYGLPTSRIEDLGPVYVVRLQRAVIQLWKTDQPWARAGQVTIANGGDIFKEAGMIESGPATPHPAPGYEGHGPAPVLRAPAVTPRPAQPADRAAAARPAASATPVPSSAGTIVRQIDPRRRTQPAYLQEVPNADFIIIKLRQRTACENAWMGHGFFEVQDKDGRPLDKVTIVTQSGDTIVRHISGTKAPGKVEAYFYRGNWTAWVEKDENGRPVTSDRAVNMDTMIFTITPEEHAERFCNGVETITVGHYSYDVTFRKVR
ncbi:MAG: hypothetical protein RMM58_04325 [Chloroflexota bacterium]|nr:hypothetical protein [Dehalococcoidia bacterium]MDW8253088.1 hypothetical protein [Chloroflexota bacterium]